ncbi:MAG: TIM barrel protein [Candidatus Coatesbacteria bacterium]
MQICVFSKNFQDLNADRLGRLLSGLKVPGVDLTVREGGHVEPAKVVADLPRFLETLKQHGVGVTMLTTSITDIHAPNAKAVIEAAGKLGVRFIKLGYWNYRGWGHYREQERAVRADLAGIEPVLLANGVTAGIHTHSGDYLGLNTNYIMRLIEDRDPKALGVFYDIGHNTLEGSNVGWRMDLDLARDRIVMVALKSMLWERRTDARAGERPWRWKVVPLSDGLADVPAFIGFLKQIPFTGPVSFHSEYKGDYSWRDLAGQDLIDQTRRDLDYARPLLESGS